MEYIPEDDSPVVWGRYSSHKAVFVRDSGPREACAKYSFSFFPYYILSNTSVLTFRFSQEKAKLQVLNNLK